MTQKELLYIEDAVGHEKTIIKVCDDMIDKLNDEKLESFIQDEKEKHQSYLNGLMEMLEVKSNG